MGLNACCEQSMHTVSQAVNRQRDVSWKKVRRRTGLDFCFIEITAHVYIYRLIMLDCCFKLIEFFVYL